MPPTSFSPSRSRLLSLACQKFVFTVASDALTYHKHRKTGRRHPVLLPEDLSEALRDQGIDVARPLCLPDSLSLPQVAAEERPTN